MFFAGCKDNVQSPIPNYPVYLELNLTSTYPTFRNSVNQFLEFKTREKLPETSSIGFGGIIVYSGSSLDDYGNTQYYAFDMACPYEIKRDVKVYPDTNGLSHVICEKCGSVFDVSFGSGGPISGPAKDFLKRYKTSLSGDVLYITK